MSKKAVGAAALFGIVLAAVLVFRLSLCFRPPEYSPDLVRHLGYAAHAGDAAAKPFYAATPRDFAPEPWTNIWPDHRYVYPPMALNFFRAFSAWNLGVAWPKLALTLCELVTALLIWRFLSPVAAVLAFASPVAMFWTSLEGAYEGLVTMLLALAFVSAKKSRWLAAGAVLALALNAKQWAVLGAPLILIELDRRSFRRFVLGLALGMALFAPWYLETPGLYFEARSHARNAALNYFAWNPWTNPFFADHGAIAISYSFATYALPAVSGFAGLSGWKDRKILVAALSLAAWVVTLKSIQLGWSWSFLVAPVFALALSEKRLTAHAALICFFVAGLDGAYVLSGKAPYHKEEAANRRLATACLWRCDYGAAHRNGFLEVRGRRLHYVEAGPPTAPLALLVHGFGDHWRTFAALMPRLALDHHVVAIDLPGFNLSDAPPPGAEHAAWDLLVGDVKTVITSFGATRATIIGHDLGAYLGWIVADQNPELVTGLVAIATPHPAAFHEAFREDPAQRRASAYLQTYAGPKAAEHAAKLDPILPWVGENEAAFYVEARRKSSMPATVALYAALLPKAPYAPVYPAKKVEVPTLVVYGKRDEFVLATTMRRSADHVRTGLYSELAVENAKHDPQREAAALVRERIADWMAEPRERPPTPILPLAAWRVEAQTIDSELSRGYRLAVAGVDGDGRRDLLAIGEDARWYRAPLWEMTSLVQGSQLRGLSDIAPHVLPGIARATPFVADGFDAAHLETKGRVLRLDASGARELHSAPGLHRLAWLRLDAARGTEQLLIAAQIVGAGGLDAATKLASTGDGKTWLDVPLNDLHLLRGVTAIDFDRDGRDELLLASKDGVLIAAPPEWRRQVVSTHPAGEAKLGKLAGGQRFVVTLEPWHGSELVVHVEEASGAWRREPLASRQDGSGHGLLTVDLDGDGSDEIVGCFFGKNPGLTLSRRVSYRSWEHRTIDTTIDCQHVVAANLENPATMLLAAVGDLTHDVRLYRVSPQ